MKHVAALEEEEDADSNDAEAEKSSMRVGIAYRKVFARPESFAHIFKIDP